ncbi:MAG: ABC transporter substrate-binding protein [Candidatus Pacebacteria bacterium]|nr:ABC transporter substrate-binding protein [Candidatus Paceibacterota bacterium]
MQKDGILQKILIAVFGIGILAGVIVFAVGSSQSSQQGTVTILIWGTVPRGSMNQVVNNINQTNKDIRVMYIQKSVDTFYSELVDALASGFGPDVVIYPGDFLGRMLDKAFILPYEQYPITVFQSQYVDAGSVALTATGVAGFPLGVDPVMMYFNRDILVNNFLTRPPQYWDEMLQFAKTVTRRDGLSLTQSAVALGSLRNINHAKDIFALISMQAGNTLTDKRDGKLISVLSNPGTNIVPPVESAVSFFLQFSNTQSDVYSWNSGLPRSLDMFLAGNLALYFGPSSEFQSLRTRNPNLNFDVTMMPQLRSANRRMTLSDVLFVSTTKVSQNQISARQIMFSLLAPDMHRSIIDSMGYQSARRDVLVAPVQDPYKTMFNNSAMISMAWVDPLSEETDVIFEKMMNDVVSGAQNVTGAVAGAHKEMERLISTRIRQF